MGQETVYQETRNRFKNWQQQIQESILTEHSSLMHTFACYFDGQAEFIQHLQDYAYQVAAELEPLAAENNQDANLPSVQHYSPIGERQDTVIHHPSYSTAGDIIYGSNMMKYLSTAGHMLKTLSLFLLSSHAGEAGHHCPIACSAGIIRILRQYPQIPNSGEYLDKLTYPSFQDNYTGAQFLTEIQGGSDVGANYTQARLDEEEHWRITGEKWFCSNANADLILLTARYNEKHAGTGGLGLFLVPARISENQANHYRIHRLKQKIGTRSMATGEIDFEGAYAFLIGEAESGIHLVMENVLHVSRIFNAFSVLGMARRAYQIAYYYALNREAFQKPIIDYPLVRERLAHIKAENIAMLASIFHMTKCQDDLDQMCEPDMQKKLLLRTMANLNKYFTAMRSVENVHHCLGILAGNGTIETFSSLPRLLRDCIVCENWEGTHFVLWMQILRDIGKFKVDALVLDHIEDLLKQINNEICMTALKENHTLLAKKITELKSLKTTEQTLKIQDIVLQMITLLSAAALALELQQGEPPADKKAALTLFMRKYIHPEYGSEENYLNLLNAVIL